MRAAGGREQGGRRGGGCVCARFFRQACADDSTLPPLLPPTHHPSLPSLPHTAHTMLELSNISAHLTEDKSSGLLTKASPYAVFAATDASGTEIRAQTRAVSRGGGDVTWGDTLVLDGDFKPESSEVGGGRVGERERGRARLFFCRSSSPPSHPTPPPHPSSSSPSTTTTPSWPTPCWGRESSRSPKPPVVVGWGTPPPAASNSMTRRTSTPAC